jgi:hypothetical protein
MAHLLSKLIGETTVGFRMHEIMTGRHEFVGKAGPRGEFPFSFELDWGTDNLLTFVNPLSGQSYTAQARGVVRMGQFADEAPCEGTLEFCYFTEAKIRYRFRFSVKEKEYEYIGEKVGIRPWNLHRTHTTCYGVVYDMEKGNEISRSITYFKFETLPAFLTSFCVVRA